MAEKTPGKPNFAFDQEAFEAFQEGNVAWQKQTAFGRVFVRFFLMVSVVLAMGGVVLSAGVVWEGKGIVLLPYVVLLKKNINVDNNIVHVFPEDATNVPPQVLKTFVKKFVVKTHEIVGDPLADQKTTQELEQFVKPLTNPYFFVHNFRDHRTTSKFEKKASITVKIDSIKIEGVDNKKRPVVVVDWSETAWLASGEKINLGTNEGYFTVSVHPQTSYNVKNPFGLMIDRVSWSKIVN